LRSSLDSCEKEHAEPVMIRLSALVLMRPFFIFSLQIEKHAKAIFYSLTPAQKLIGT
jgi:hypothetical protein